MAPKAPALYLIDGHAQLYRAYHVHARENRRATDGTPTGALYGFFNQLKSIRTRYKPELLGCVFDPKEGTFREKEFEGYKAHRAPMPDDLRQQIPLAMELCKGYGIPAIQVENYEADDILGALAQQAVERGYNVVIVTGDKDLLQLVTDRIHVYDPMKDILFEPTTVEDLKGLKPTQIVDWLGLMGDSADNIPGVTGVGSQTAVKLLEAHGTLEEVLEYYQDKYEYRRQEILDFVEAHSAEAKKDKSERKTVKPPKKIKVVDAYLFAQGEQARASRELARIRVDAPVTFDEEQFRLEDPEPAKLAPLLQKLDFRQFLRDIGDVEVPLTAAEQKAKDDEGKREYHIVDTPAALKTFAAKLAKQKRFAFDTETTATQVRQARLVGVSFSWKKHEAWYLPVLGPAGAKVLDEKAVLDACRKPLENAKVGKVGQNLKYDLNVMRGLGVNLRGISFDTLIAGWLLDPGALRHDIDTLAYTHLHLRKTATGSLIGKDKPPTMDLVAVEDVGRYACEDADVAWQLAEIMSPKLKEAKLDRLMADIETPLIEVLAQMEWTGIRVNADLLGEMSESLGVQLAAQEEEIYKIAGETFTINSPKQLGQILFERLELPVLSKTSTGQPSTNEDALKQLASKHELPRLILEYRQFSKLKSTYVDALPELIAPETGRIHAGFHQAGTETGRLSSSNPNLQNIPIRSELGRSIRAAFLPGTAKWKIVGADYSQIELRMLAHYSQDPVLLKGFADGVDIHRAVAARLNDCDEKDVTSDQRASAKTVNFGVLYGQTAFGLAQTLGIPRKEAQEIINRFFEEHPAVRGCVDKIIEDAHAAGYVTTILGRRRFIPQLKEKAQRKLGERIAVNTVFQGSAADLIKKAMLDIHRDLADPEAGWDARMLLQIHDELLFECPARETRDLTRLVKEKMEGALKLRVPLLVEVAVGDDWLSAKD